MATTVNRLCSHGNRNDVTVTPVPSVTATPGDDPAEDHSTTTPSASQKGLRVLFEDYTKVMASGTQIVAHCLD
ncbi:hypothetical protein CRUP_026680 [Coryphaenoides rupestris]|nr:hypothetical protein CRUP_026680 [Coryphaenoides rupestris]